MTAASSYWELDPKSLSESLARWREHDPPAEAERMVETFLMDLVVDPLRVGKEDDSRGVWTGWAGPFVLVIYVPNREERMVYVADINYG